MIELVRVIQNQNTLYAYRVTQSVDEAQQLELLFEMTKPTSLYAEWHPLIATPFRYSPPLRVGRFCSEYGKNIFYGSLIEETALYEHAFHFMKQRMHLPQKTDIGTRTIFFVDADDTNSVNIRGKREEAEIMDKNDYSASHQFVIANPHISFILYPSCRDPEKRDNAAILNINHLEKFPKWESSIHFFYDNQEKKITWLDYQLDISWHQLA